MATEMDVVYGKTRVEICGDTADLGRCAAAAVASALRAAAARQEVVRAVFAAGESQQAFFHALAVVPDVPWKRIDCFNIDDFWDPRMPREFTCGYQACKQLYDHVKPRTVNLVDFAAADPQTEARRFEALLREAPIDVLCQGIGTSGHLALDEPWVSDFNDPRWVRVVMLAEQSKSQLRDDPNFRDLGYVPEHGICMTIPGIVAAREIFTIVPLALKKPILMRLADTDAPTPALPASILFDNLGTLFVDHDSCPDGWRQTAAEDRA